MRRDADRTEPPLAWRPDPLDMLPTMLVLLVIASVYSYALYPLILLLLPKRTAAVVRDAAPPSVSLIITAHNEAATIADKIDNSLAIRYAGPLEIVVASDCSEDGTDEIVRGFAADGVRLVRADQRLGKEYAQLCAIRAVDSDVVVFSDTGTRIEPDGITLMMRSFADPAVGAVSSEDRFISADGEVAGEGLYVRYEMWLRSLESARGGLVGLSGSFFAARRALLDDWDILSPSDFNTALMCANAGYVAVSDPEVVGIYRDIADPAREYQRKLRTAIRGMTGLARHPEALSPARGLFAFQLFSHKIMRWLVPWFLLGTLLVSLLLAPRHPAYAVFFGLQAAAYGVCLLLHFMPALRVSLLRVGYFFAQVNLALAHAGVQFLLGRRITVWEPSRR